MDEYISREAVFQVVHGIARGIATKDTEALNAKDMKTFYKIKGAKAILDSVDTDLCYVPVADVQPVDRWISVDERLPKTGESVLVYVAINENLKGFGECKPEIRIGWLDDGDKWALQFSNMNYSEVLCWMPLPEPPRAVKYNENNK